MLQVLLGRGDPARALLLEAVQDEHRFLELHGVDHAVLAARLVFDHFQNAGADETLEALWFLPGQSNIIKTVSYDQDWLPLVARLFGYESF